MNSENQTKNRYEFSIRGRIEFENDRDDGYGGGKGKDDFESQRALHQLNSTKYAIADKISNTLERQLPSAFGGNVKIETTLEFGEGSITWMGVVAVLDWVGRIVDTVSFVQMISSAIEFAVNKVMAEEVTQYSIPVAYETISTRVLPDFALVSQTDFLYRNLLLAQDEQIRILRGLSRNLDNLLRYIGQVQRRNSMFRLPNNFVQRPNYPTFLFPQVQRPRQFPKDTIILVVLVLLLILETINYFGLETSMRWIASIFKISP